MLGAVRGPWLQVAEARVGGVLLETQVPAYTVAVVLAMSDDEGRAALARLLEQVAER